jgi:hypothetical protein
MSETTELQQLRDRIAELEGQLAAASAGGETSGAPVGRDRAPERWRSVVAAVLIVVGCILAPLAITAVWANRQVSDTDRYVETVAPLAKDPAVQAAVATKVSAAVLQALDVPALTSDVVDGLAKQGLPPRAVQGLRALEVPLNNGIEGFVNSSVSKVISSDQFAALWVAANRSAHNALVNLMSGNQGGAISAQNGQVTLNLGPIIAQVKQQLISAGYTVAEKIPSIDKSFVLIQSQSVTKLQGLYRLLNTLGYWLPIIALAFLAIGVFIAHGHRRALIGACIGVVLGMLAVGVALAVGRVYYLNAVPSDVLPREAAENIFDTMVRFLRTGLRATAVLALIVAIGAYFSGPSPTATRTRDFFSRGIGGARSSAESHGVQTGAFGTWVFAHKRAIWLGLVIAGGFTLTFWSRPTAGIVIVTALVVLVLVGIVELLARPPEVAPVVVNAADIDAPGTEAALPPQSASMDNDEKLPAGHRT